MQTSAFTAAQTAYAAAATGPGRLLGVQITTQGSVAGAAIIIYDNASAATGAILFSSWGSGIAAINPGWYGAGPVGMGIPYANGLWVASQSSGSAGVVVYSPGVPNDGRPAT